MAITATTRTTPSRSDTARPGTVAEPPRATEVIAQPAQQHRGRSGGCLRVRQNDPHAKTAAGRVAGAHATPVQCDRARRNRQADARTSSRGPGDAVKGL